MTQKEPRVAYEPHPVTPARKKELRSQGFRIIDAVFAPAGHVLQQGSGKVPEVQEREALLRELRDRGIVFDEALPTDELRALMITPQNPDGLDDLDADALHALAKDRGVKIHHKAGADKVREALRESTQGTTGE